MRTGFSLSGLSKRVIGTTWLDNIDNEWCGLTDDWQRLPYTTVLGS